MEISFVGITIQKFERLFFYLLAFGVEPQGYATL
jgi:hypothetical protein